MPLTHSGLAARLCAWLLLSCLCFWEIGSVWAETSPPNTPSVISLNAPVIDKTNTLSVAEMAALDAKLRAIHAAGRAQIGIVLVPSTGNEATFDAALRMAEQWKLGTTKLDNGLLIFVAVQDRRIQILTGYGLEAVLPDVITSRIIREVITPAFREGDYAGGLSAAVERIDQILQLDPEIAKSQAMQAQDQTHQEPADPLTNMFMLGFFLFVFGQILRSILGRFIGASLVSGLAVFVGYGFFGLPLIFALIMAVILFFLIISSSGMSGGSRGRGGRGGLIYGGGGWSGGYSSGGGGYSGGGGGFGGGGASGSW